MRGRTVSSNVNHDPAAASAAPPPGIKSYARLPREVPRLDINLMLTCRQLHAEVADVLYTRNTFLMEDASHVEEVQLRTLIPRIHPHYVSHIRQVRASLNFPDSNWTPWIRICEMLQRWKNVEVLVLRMRMEFFNKRKDALQRIGNHDTAVKQLAKQVKTICTMNDLKPSKDLRVSLQLEHHATGKQQEILKELQEVANEALRSLRRTRKIRQSEFGRT